MPAIYSSGSIASITHDMMLPCPYLNGCVSLQQSSVSIDFQFDVTFSEDSSTLLAMSVFESFSWFNDYCCHRFLLKCHRVARWARTHPAPSERSMRLSPHSAQASQTPREGRGLPPHDGRPGR